MDDMTELPEPLVPADVDLRGMPFMPLYIDRLQKSKAWLLCKRRPELAFFLMNLWMRSWQEVPAASLEDDEDVLADAAMVDHKTWSKVRADALRGWVKCSDGRLYHPVVAELAVEAWGQRQAYRERTAKARQARQQRRGSADKENVTDPDTVSVTEPVTALKGEGQGEVSDRERDREIPPDGGSAQARRAGKYAFEGRVIRLTEADFTRWKAAYSAIPDLRAELSSLDDWLSGQPEEKRKRWFHTVSSALSRKHQEWLEKRQQAEAAKPAPRPRLQYDEAVKALPL
jgi:uncharacterized protein YdaU (DUF1376 family)